MTTLGRRAIGDCLGRILGIDMGKRRIGVAISAPEGVLAVPLQVIECRGDEIDARAITEIARKEGVETLVVGHPRSLDGTIGPQARRVEAFARRLAEASGLPLELWDERLSSKQAERPPPHSGKRRNRGPRKRRASTDDAAAAIILESYLHRHRGDASSSADL